MMNRDADHVSEAQPVKRFRVALSFPGTRREFVKAVAEGLAERLGREKVFYDNWYKAELARPDLDLVIGDIYYKEAELTVPFFCADYANRNWCEHELRQLRALQFQGEGKRVMPFRFDGAEILGARPTDGFIRIEEDTPENRANSDCTVTPEDVVGLILERLGYAGEVRSTRAPWPLIDPLHTIPPPPENFTGRGADLTALRGLDPAGGAVLTGLKGMGGIGKTALALVLAKEWKGRFPDAQILLDGMGLSDAAPAAGKLMEQVIHAFHPDAKLPEGALELKPLYTQVLTGKRVLLLLDNAKDKKQAEPLIPPAGCGLIVTSRQGFPLGMQRPYKLGSLTEMEARELLRKYVPEIANAQAEELGTLCGGLPFALNLAGAVLLAEASDTGAAPDVARYVTKLRANRLEAFDKAARDTAVDEDAVTVTETLRLSEAPLTPEQRDAWRALSVFPAPFDERAALAVAGADEETLRELMHRSLVEKEKGRLKLHDLAAEYAQRELGDEVLEEKWRAYVAHYTAVAWETNAAYLAGGEKLLVGLRLFDAERAHVEAAFGWLKERTDRPSAHALIALVNAVSLTAELRFHPRQRIQWEEARLQSARETGDRNAEGSALGNLGIAHAHLGDAREAIEHFEKQLLVCRETANRLGESIALNNFGNVHAGFGGLRKAIEFFTQSLIISQEMGDRHTEGATLGNLGVAYKSLGNARKAIECYEESLAISRETGNRQREGINLNNLGIAYVAIGDVHKGIEYYEQDLVICREMGDRRGEGHTLGNLGTAYKRLGEARKAIGYHEQVLAICRETGDRHGEGIALGNLGIAHADLRDTRKAIEYYEQQLVITRETGDLRGEGNALWNSAILLEQQGDRQQAISRAEEALWNYGETEDPNATMVRRWLEKWKSAGGEG
jgi:tetratricopeptide (TPR) repeat protein